MMTTNIAVIGAGIIGLSSAINIQRSIPNAKVTIIADQFGAQNVSFGAGGLYRPELDKLVQGDNEEVIRQCLRDSWNHFVGLAMSEHCKASGQFLVHGFVSHRKPMGESYDMMRECTFDFHQLSEKEIERRGIPKEFKYTYSCTSVISQPDIYVPWLTQQFESNGGIFQKRTVHKIEELYGQFQLVVNCCGLRAKTFLGDDKCTPVRGQIIRTKAPFFKHFHFFDTDVYMIPHQEKLIIGGIRIVGDGNTKVDPKVTESILRKAEAMYPELKGAEVISAWANSRPGRSNPRMELETLHLGGNRKLKVIHNYGHGGNGITLSWGSGVYMAKLAKEALLQIPRALL